ncbi:transmembrane prolyl 4-hydroxylase-like [Asterias rubens]|uniref:transmembrane prolyl 4-hydroxylase-like n=1 Tax=Asterias rubens TaxID=7604 RepID=UPI001455BE73|nr:transmembrane prolyl 4-hydroxylase-like [Asterias rubens]
MELKLSVRIPSRQEVCRMLALFIMMSVVQRVQPNDVVQENLKLYQLDPVAKGHVRLFEADPGRILRVETKALQPPVFEIPDFLTPEECEYIVGRALNEGLYPSGVNDEAYYNSLANSEDTDEDDVDTTEEDSPTDEETTSGVFNELDVNNDMVLDAEEVLAVLNTENTFLRPKDVLQMYSDLNLDPDSDGWLTLDEFMILVSNDRLMDVENWVWKRTGHQENRIRESKQAWLGQPGPAKDPILANLQKRVVSLTKLPETIVQWSEQLQVVRYETGGHFHAHYDSNELDSDMECMRNGQTGRFCRFMTILYYLDDTLRGGETAFPIADNGTYSEKATKTEIYDLSQHCHDANLFIKPEKGKAVMWYNHYINQTTGWMGDLNHYSLHGGCEVLEGTKWIANNWIWVDDSYDKHVEHLESVQKALEDDDDDGRGTEETKASLDLAVPQEVHAVTDLQKELDELERVNVHGRRHHTNGEL